MSGYDEDRPWRRPAQARPAGIRPPADTFVAPPPDDPPVPTPESGSVVGRGIWALAGRVVPQVYTIVGAVTVARILGAESFGRVAFISFVGALGVSLLTLGLPQALLRSVAETMGEGHPGDIHRLYRWSLRLETLAAVVGFGALAAIGILGASPTLAWVLVGFVCAASVVQNVPSSVLLGMNKFGAATAIGLVTGGAGIVAKVVVVSAGGGIVGVFAVDAAAAAVNAVVTAILLRRAMPEPAVSARADLRVKAMRRFAAVSSIGTVVTLVLWNRSELLFLDRMSTDTQIALYSVSFSIILMLGFLPAAISAVLIPSVASAFGAGDHEHVRNSFWGALRLSLVLVMIVGGVSVAAGPDAIVVLFGPKFDAAGDVLLLLLIGYPALPLFYVSGAVMLGVGRQRIPIAISGMAAVVNIALAVLLIGRYDAVGAAIANAGAQLAAAIPLTWYAARAVGGQRALAIPPFIRLGVIVACATAVGVGIAHVLSPLPGMIAATVAYAVLSAALSFVLRPLDPRDASVVARLLPSRLGRFIHQIAR